MAVLRDARKASYFLFLILATVVSTAKFSAQEHPFLKRGATRAALTSIDSVNLANGAGVLNIPIGNRVQIGGGLSFGISLFYNSKVWDTRPSERSDPLQGALPISFPSRKSTAGMGWTVSLGELIPPGIGPFNDSPYWLYIDPSAGNHFFYEKMRPNDISAPSVHYTRDGSYMRLSGVPHGGSGGQEITVEMPNGEAHIFERVTDEKYRLRRITNRFGADGPDYSAAVNFVDITYSTSGLHEVVTATDSHARDWVIFFKTVIYDYNDPPPKTYRLVDRVEVPGFGDEQITYNFEYTETDLVDGCAWRDYDINNQIPVPLLDRVLLPEATPNEGRRSWEFDYYENTSTNYEFCRQGLIDLVTLPTGGAIHWDYDDLELRPHCDDPDDFRFFWSRSAALTKRQYLDVEGVDADDDGERDRLATWSYFYDESVPPDHVAGPIRCDDEDGNEDLKLTSEALTVREITPTGDFVYHFFMKWSSPFPTENGSTGRDFFLPYLRPGIKPTQRISLVEPPFFENVTPAMDADGRFISRVVFDCDGGIFTCTPFSADYVKYENEYNGSEDQDYLTDRHDRQISAKTIYFKEMDDVLQSHAVFTDSSEYDGFGNFERVTSHSTYPGEFKQVMRRDYDYESLNESAPWLLRTFSSTETTLTDAQEPLNGDAPECSDGESRCEQSRVETLFNPSTGFLERQRTWTATGPLASQSRQSNDILTVFEADPAGNIASVSTYGGDRQNDLTDQDLASVQLGDWEYRRERTYQNGYLDNEIQAGRHGGSLSAKDLDLDTNTGLPTASRDIAGLETTFEYDKLGRLSRVTPSHDAPTQATRTPASAGTGEIVLLQRLSGDEAIYEERFVQDGFGRNISEEVKVAGGFWSRTSYGYGSNGFLSTLSTPHWSHQEPTFFTQLLDYDPKGRPLRTVNPDGTEVRLEIDRDHLFETFSSRATGPEESEISSRLYRDSQSRILAAEEKSDGESWVTTTYQYDVGGRVSTVRTPLSATGFQQRLFTYDNRGFLESESHPETGTILYGNYDSAGHTGTRSDGAHALAFVHDEFGRVHQTWDASTNHILSEILYSRKNRDGEPAKGRIVLSKRHNHLDSGEDRIISQAYGYDAGQGRLSELRTRSNDGLNTSQVYAYDGLGNLTTHGYPLQDFVANEAGPDRRVASTFLRGQLTNLDTGLDGGPLETVISDFFYHPQGVVSSRRHANGVRDEFAIDSWGMNRPSSMGTSGVAGGMDWQSGAFAYDGSGHIKTIGSDTFHYDAVSRLIHAKVGGISQDYDYDRFGNLLELGDREFDVDEISNRLHSPFSYDGAGNLLSGDDFQFTYDALNMAISSGDRRFLYGPGNERVATVENNGSERWTIRDSNQRVAREFSRATGGPWIAERDYLYADGVAAAYGLEGGSKPELERHYHLDHLGSTRLITDGEGVKVSAHTFLPFGEEIADSSNPVPDGEVLKFTGHERDSSGLDYMHARYYGPKHGRFLSVDPLLGKADSPQSWNRYSYVANNPILGVDPDGQQFLYFFEIKLQKRGRLPKKRRDGRPGIDNRTKRQYKNDNKMERYGGVDSRGNKIAPTPTAVIAYDDKIIDQKYPHLVGANNQARGAATEELARSELKRSGVDIDAAQLRVIPEKGTLRIIDFAGKAAPGVIGLLFIADELNAAESTGERVGIIGREALDSALPYSGTLLEAAIQHAPEPKLAPRSSPFAP